MKFQHFICFPTQFQHGEDSYGIVMGEITDEDSPSSSTSSLNKSQVRDDLPVNHFSNKT
jgi:hypothetical protein